MIPGATPLAAWPLASLWTPPALPPRGPARAEDVPGPGCWLAEIAATLAAAPPVVVPAMPGATPPGAYTLPALAPSLPSEIRVSDRGWRPEPDDPAAPGGPYAARLAEPPAIERSVPLRPDAPRRASVAVGELLLLNGDGRYDSLAGDWRYAGQRVRLHRGPYRAPLAARRAEFGAVADLRVAAPPTMAADGVLRLALRGADADLDVPLCETYGGTGGADGHAGLAGQDKPRLLGRRRNVEPTLEDPGLLLYRYHHGGPAAAVLAVRASGAPLTFAGDVPTRAALEAAVVAPGTYITCLADGTLRIGATATLLTIDARGDATPALGGYASTAGAIARRILQTAGGIGGERIADFGWPLGEAGLYLRGGTVAEALDRLAAGVAGWWGADAFGVFGGGILQPPEAGGASLILAPHMLEDAPAEVPGIGAPMWRIRVGYAGNDRVQTGGDLAGSVAAEDAARWGRDGEIATALDLDARARFPLAADGPLLPAVLDAQADAQAVAERLLAMHGRPRRMWTARLARWHPLADQPGAIARLTWPGDAALRAGAALVVIGVSRRGDAAELQLWG